MSFWDLLGETYSRPPLPWKKWWVQNNLVLLAKENIIFDTFYGPKLEMAELPLEPMY